MVNRGKKELTRVCEYCEYARIICDDANVLCSHRGVVAKEYRCRRFSYDPLKRTPTPPQSFNIPDAKELQI